MIPPALFRFTVLLATRLLMDEVRRIPLLLFEFAVLSLIMLSLEEASSIPFRVLKFAVLLITVLLMLVEDSKIPSPASPAGSKLPLLKFAVLS